MVGLSTEPKTLNSEPWSPRKRFGADRITIYVTRKSCYAVVTVIVSYRDKATERFASGRHVKEFSGFSRQAEMRLDRLETATSLADLAGLPGNRLEALKGDRAGQF